MERLNRAVPAFLEKNATSVATARQRLISVGPHITERSQAELARGAARLEDLSPIKTLARGYSVTRDESGKIISSIDQTQIGQRVIVSLVDGRLDCAVGDIDEIDLFGRNKEIKHG
jgi:exodeoxyribonuclease VII large subunit